MATKLINRGGNFKIAHKDIKEKITVINTYSVVN